MIEAFLVECLDDGHSAAGIPRGLAAPPTSELGSLQEVDRRDPKAGVDINPSTERGLWLVAPT